MGLFRACSHDCNLENPARIWLSGWKRLPFAPACHRLPARSKVKALHNSEPSGCAKIKHPFHPLLDQQFPILKTRIVSGCQTLILQGAANGTFAVPIEWTDQNSSFSPDHHQQENLILDFRGLLALNDFLKKLDISIK
ncbi:DUF5372 family protein [Desulfosarcina variabilis]|uniref:DUF5372 family protein n=1 Tax=Desulfosarcina variabilis TaxID=2300 RepID=UPI003AFB4C53